MEIDNSRANTFRRCPWEYYEAYIRNVEPRATVGDGYSALELGSRVHELLEEHYSRLAYLEPLPGREGYQKYEPSPNVALEAEAQWMLTAYCAHYPADKWTILDCERTFKVALPGGKHVLTGKMDLFLRDDEDGYYYINDHKTERRGAKSNIPQKWAMRDQPSLYLYAARHIYPDYKVNCFQVNILTRPSDKGKVGPSFPDRQKLERSDEQIDRAVRDIVQVADQIEEFTARYGDGPWPANNENCYGWGYCDYYQPHLYGGWTPEMLQRKFQPKQEYLHLNGIPIIQPR